MNSIASRLLRPIMNRVLPSAATVVSVRSGAAAGASLLILPREEKYYWTGQYELEVQRATLDLLRPGDQFWDIGAHIGFFTVIASRAVGPAGKVHAFEPYGPSRERLGTNITLNHLRNVVVHEEALSAASGSSILHANAASSMWTLVPSFGEPTGVRVECTTISALADLIGLPNVIKIDAEGAELEIVRGGIDALMGPKGPALVVEFSNASLVREARSLLPHHSFVRITERHWIVALSPLAST